MKVVSTSNAPAAIGPYSQAIDLGNMVFVSGQIPVDPATGKMADTVEEQAAQSLGKPQGHSGRGWLSMANVVKTVIFLADINDFAAVNAVYAKAFAEPFPARSCVQVRPSPRAQSWRSSASPCVSERAQTVSEYRTKREPQGAAKQRSCGSFAE